MAYLIVADRDQELDRLEISGPMTIGRAPDCDLSLHDAMLSRHHCLIERLGERWIITDLRSRNGTHVGAERIGRHVLVDGEVVRIGRTRLCFFSGEYVPNTIVPRWTSTQRPRDPNEALAGTIIGLALSDMEDDSRLSGFPIPRPNPADPCSYRSEHVHELVTSMSSGIWDTKLMTESRPARSRMLPRPLIDPQRYVAKVVTTRTRQLEAEELPPRQISRTAIPRRTPTRAQRWFVAASIISAMLVWVASTLVIFLV